MSLDSRHFEDRAPEQSPLRGFFEKHKTRIRDCFDITIADDSLHGAGIRRRDVVTIDTGVLLRCDSTNLTDNVVCAAYPDGSLFLGILKGVDPPTLALPYPDRTKEIRRDDLEIVGPAVCLQRTFPALRN